MAIKLKRKRQDNDEKKPTLNSRAKGLDGGMSEILRIKAKSQQTDPKRFKNQYEIDARLTRN